MKNLNYLILFVLIAASCADSSNNKFDTYLNYKWGTDNNVLIENSCIHSKTHFDTSTKEMVGDTLIPIKRIDSTLIITQIVGKGKWDLVGNNFKFFPTSDTMLIDSFYFEFTNFKGPKLLLFKKDIEDATVYTLLESKDIKLNNYESKIKFEIADYSIGDTINRELLVIDDVNNYDSYSTEQAELKSNEDIDFDLIGDNTIFKITQSNISNLDIDDIIKVVNSKMHIEPKYTPMTKSIDYEVEYYRWKKYGIEVTLQKMKYIGQNYYQKLYSKNNWTLYYEDKLMETLLINEFKNSTPKSTIIK